MERRADPWPVDILVETWLVGALHRFVEVLLRQVRHQLVHLVSGHPKLVARRFLRRGCDPSSPHRSCQQNDPGERIGRRPHR